MEKRVMLLKKKGGFTLIELIVVLVIMGLLTAAIVPTVTQYVGTARETVTRSNLQMIENSAQLYLADLLLAGEFPNGLIITADKLVEQGYLTALPSNEQYEIVNKKIMEGEIHKKVVGSENTEGWRKNFNEQEMMKYREVFETKELEEIKKQVKDTYENGKRVGRYIGEFDKYKEHYEIEGGHIEKVYLKSLQAADAAENLFRNNDYNAFYSPVIDRKTLGMMAWYHDTGMDGNIEGKDAEKMLAEKEEEKPSRQRLGYDETKKER